MKNAIEVKSLIKKFGSFKAVDNINFSVSKGEIFGFLGPNGAGKTTTIRMLCGILQSSSGDAFVGGYSIVNDPENVKMNIGYMSQKFSLYDDLTVEENIDFFGGVYGLGGTLLSQRKKWVLDIANLKNKESILTGSLPGGIKQRLALGTAVIHSPKIIFLDEPTSGVDPISRRSFWELINDLSNKGTTIFVTTHYLEEAEFCNNIILINAGKLIAEGNPKDLKTNYLKNKIIELECSDPVSAMEIFENEEYVDETSIFGINLHLNVNDKFKNIGQIKSLLIRNDINVVNVNEIVPTLEDVFINLLDKKENV